MSKDKLLFYDSDEDQDFYPPQVRQRQSSHSLSQDSANKEFQSVGHENNFQPHLTENKTKIHKKNTCCQPWIWLPILILIIGLIGIAALLLATHVYFLVNSLETKFSHYDQSLGK